MIVGDNAPVKCSCGSRVCWEAHASEKASLKRYKKMNGLSEKVSISFEQLIDLARQGEPSAVKTLTETAHFLGIGISNLIVGFSPQAVVISGNIVRAWDLIKDEINYLAGRSVRQELEKTTIMASSLGNSPTIIGSLSLVLVRKFASAN